MKPALTLSDGLTRMNKGMAWVWTTGTCLLIGLAFSLTLLVTASLTGCEGGRQRNEAPPNPVDLDIIEERLEAHDVRIDKVETAVEDMELRVNRDLEPAVPPRLGPPSPRPPAGTTPQTSTSGRDARIWVLTKGGEPVELRPDRNDPEAPPADPDDPRGEWLEPEKMPMADPPARPQYFYHRKLKQYHVQPAGTWRLDEISKANIPAGAKVHTVGEGPPVNTMPADLEWVGTNFDGTKIMREPRQY